MRPEAVVGYMGLACVTVGMFAGSAEALFVGAGCMGLPAVIRAGSGVRRAGTDDPLPDGAARYRQQYVADEIDVAEFERRLDVCFGLVDEVPPLPAGVIRMTGGQLFVPGEDGCLFPVPRMERLER